MKFAKIFKDKILILKLSFKNKLKKFQTIKINFKNYKIPNRSQTKNFLILIRRLTIQKKKKMKFYKNKTNRIRKKIDFRIIE